MRPYIHIGYRLNSIWTKCYIINIIIMISDNTDNDIVQYRAIVTLTTYHAYYYTNIYTAISNRWYNVVGCKIITLVKLDKIIDYKLNVWLFRYTQLPSYGYFYKVITRIFSFWLTEEEHIWSTLVELNFPWNLYMKFLRYW